MKTTNDWKPTHVAVFRSASGSTRKVQIMAERLPDCSIVGYTKADWRNEGDPSFSCDDDVEIGGGEWYYNGEPHVGYVRPIRGSKE